MNRNWRWGTLALPQASTQAFTLKFRAGTLSLQVSETVEDCISDEDEVSAASDNESILECEKELLVTTLMQNLSLILLLQVQILLILLIMMTLGDLQISIQMLVKGVSKNYMFDYLEFS